MRFSILCNICLDSFPSTYLSLNFFPLLIFVCFSCMCECVCARPLLLIYVFFFFSFFFVSRRANRHVLYGSLFDLYLSFSLQLEFKQKKSRTRDYKLSLPQSSSFHPLHRRKFLYYYHIIIIITISKSIQS